MDLEVGERDTRLGRELNDQGEDYITKSETKWLRKGIIQLKDGGCMARETVRLREDTGEEENISCECIM